MKNRCMSLFRLLVLLAVTSSMAAEETGGSKPRIGFVAMATGPYTRYVQPLMDSIEKFVLPGYEKTLFIFTDGQLPEHKNIVRIEQKRLGWPYDTIKRFEVYLTHKAAYAHMDYVFAIDADMAFVGSVGEEILGDTVGTKHFAQEKFPRKWFPYETSKKSRAGVSASEGKHYFCGGFYGGRYNSFVAMLERVVDAVNDDFSREVIAVWHDESHLNRYFIDNPPAVILPGRYCVAEEHMHKCPNVKLISCYKSMAQRKKDNPGRET